MSALKGIAPPTPPHILRIREEGDQLAERMGRLAAFTASEAFKGLPPLDAHLMTLQFETMTAYLHILQIRLARASDLHTGKALDISPTLGAKPGIVTN